MCVCVCTDINVCYYDSPLNSHHNKAAGYLGYGDDNFWNFGVDLCVNFIRGPEWIGHLIKPIKH